MTRLIITGASSGIGRELAVLAFARSYHLTLLGRNRDRLAEVSRLCGGAEWHAFDLTDSVARAQFVAGIEEPVVLVNNAGMFDYALFADQDPAAIDAMIAANLTAPILLTRALMPRLAGLVNVLSVAAQQPLTGSAVYCATKAGLDLWAQSLALEHPELPVHNFYPGPVDTPIWEGVSLDIPAEAKRDPADLAREILDALT